MMKKKNVILIIIIIALLSCAAEAFLLRDKIRDKFFGSGDGDGEVAYVDSVASWTGMSVSLNGYNKYPGVVEPQESWSPEANRDAEVSEIYVKAGDQVKTGDPLFEYDIEKYEADLAQAGIDMERLNNDLENLAETIAKLNADKRNAPASEQANYTLQIQEQELAYKQKELDIKAKQMEIDRLNDNIENAVVKSEITGVVKSVRDPRTQTDYYGGGDETGVVTIMKTGDLRVKGTVNEQNIGELTEGMEMVVHSRVNKDDTWHGVIEKIDLENTEQNANYYYGGDRETSTKKAFYVHLDSGEGLMIGQHVYLEADTGEGEGEGLWLDDYLIDMTDPDSPIVWADSEGKLVKRPVKLGEYDADMMRYEILDGLELTDLIAMPQEGMTEGMNTLPMASMTEQQEGTNEYTEGPEGGMDGEYVEEPGGGMTEEYVEPAMDGGDFSMGYNGAVVG